MVIAYIEAPGLPVDPTDLEIPSAINLAAALNGGFIDYARFIETRSLESEEIVVFEVDVERPQICSYPIHSIERIAAIFAKSFEITPKVLSLRKDFPDVPHLNLQDNEFPRSLCLYEEPFQNIKRGWTAPRFIARIRDWLALTARGSLHQEDQPLEPILLDPDGILLIPSNAFAEGSMTQPFRIIPLRDTDKEPESGKVLPIFYTCSPQTHGIVKHRPKTMTELTNLLDKAGGDFLSEVRNKLRILHQNGIDYLDSNLVFLIGFPKTRTPDGPVETTEHWAFQLRVLKDQQHTIPAPISFVGQALGVWKLSNGHPGLLIPPDITKQGDDIFLNVLNPILGMNADTLAHLNGVNTGTTTPTCCAIGVGALGSQILMNIARSGFGKWTIIDDDILLPHNLARHLLPGHFIGQLKAHSVSEFANSLSDSADVFKPLSANIFTTEKLKPELDKALNGADIILDMSASVAVARKLAHLRGNNARRISLFMSPSGFDLILIAEDANRDIRLDHLEMQYYRACIRDSHLRGHLEISAERQRYGRSCRDLSSRLPQNLVALHAAIGTKAFKDVSSQSIPSILVWRSQPDGSIMRIEVPCYNSIQMKFPSWTVVTDKAVVATLQHLRANKLPNETGGVLIGSFDVDQHIIYIADTIPSPPDSEEWPTLYIRGRHGLRPEVERINTETDGMLEYIGEWHSHPKGIKTLPSSDDMLVFQWITILMNREGLPAVMMIIGDQGYSSCFVAEMEQRENLIPA